jgi:hypothetical protein
LKWLLRILNFLTRYSEVEGGTRSLAAAPFGSDTLPFTTGVLIGVCGLRLLLELLMPRLEAMVRGEDFDPARSRERFRVVMTDHASMISLPSLAARVRRAATDVKLEVSAWRTQAYEDVAAGESIRLSVQKKHLLPWRAKYLST